MRATTLLYIIASLLCMLPVAMAEDHGNCWVRDGRADTEPPPASCLDDYKAKNQMKWSTMACGNRTFWCADFPMRARDATFPSRADRGARHAGNKHWKNPDHCFNGCEGCLQYAIGTWARCHAWRCRIGPSSRIPASRCS